MPLTLNAPTATKVVCFSRLLKCLRSLYGKQCGPRSDCSSVVPDQTAPMGAVCSGSTLFASTLNSSVMLGNHLQQTTSTNDIFRCIFLGALRVNSERKKSHSMTFQTPRAGSKEEGRDQESIQSSTTPDPGHHTGK